MSQWQSIPTENHGRNPLVGMSWLMSQNGRVRLLHTQAPIWATVMVCHVERFECYGDSSKQIGVGRQPPAGTFMQADMVWMAAIHPLEVKFSYLARYRNRPLT